MGQSVRQLIAGLLMLAVLSAGIEAAADWHAHPNLPDGEPGSSLHDSLDGHLPHDNGGDCDHCCHVAGHLVGLVTAQAADNAGPAQLRHRPRRDAFQCRGDPPPNPPPILQQAL